MSITNTIAHHDMKQHHKSRSTQNIIKLELELQQLTISPVHNHCIHSLSTAGGSSCSNSSSPTYTLSTPTTPPYTTPLSPAVQITPTLYNNRSATYNKQTTTNTNTNSSSTRPKSSKSRKLLKKAKKKAKISTKSSKKYPQFKRNSHKITAKPRWKNAAFKSNDRKNKKNIAKKHQRFGTESNIKQIKMKKTKKKNDKKRRNKTQSAKKHLKLMTSYSERTRMIPKKNYYYSNPCDMFDDKPMAVMSTKYRSNTYKKGQNQREKCTKKKGKKCGKKKKKTAHKNGLKPRRKRPRPLSSRLSDKKSLKSDEFERKINKRDHDMLEDEDTGMQYLNYDIFNEVETQTCSPIDDIDHDLEELMILKQDSEQDMHHLPLLSLSHSLSDRIDRKQMPSNKRKRKLKLQSAKLRAKTPLIKSKPIQFNTKRTKPVNNNATKRNKKQKKKRNNKLKQRKPSLKPSHSNHSNRRRKKEKPNKMKKQHSASTLYSVSNHPKGTRSMDIKLSYSDIARGVQRPTSSISASKPSFFNKIKDKPRRKSHKGPRLTSKSQHTTPTSPFWANKPLPTLVIDTTKTDTKPTNFSRRNTIALHNKKAILPKDHKRDLHLSSMDSGCSSSSISLGALSHYFQYQANHETKSILAQLAGIIMELVGEPNAFYLTFSVSPDMHMAIRRNKLRISPILRRGLVLSFAMNSVPQPLEDEYYDAYDLEMEEDYDHHPIGIDILSSSDINTEVTPPAPDLPESDLGLTSTDDDDEDDMKEIPDMMNTLQETKEENEDNDNKDEDHYNHNSDNIIWQSDGYETMEFNSSPSPPLPPSGTTLNTNKSSNNNNTTIDDDTQNTSGALPAYGLTQSHTKSTNTPSSFTPSPSSPHMKHTRSKSNSDIFTYGTGITPEFDNVQLLRSEKKHVPHSSSGSFSSFSIGSPHFNTEITSNCMSLYNDEESYNMHHVHAGNKSFGSDVTVISVSNTTVVNNNEHDDNQSEDGMVYLDDDTLKLEQKIRTPFSNTSEGRECSLFDIDTECISDTDPLPCIGYSSSANTLNNSNKKTENADIDIGPFDLCVYATNVRVPQMGGIKARPSAKILLSQTSNTGDDSGCIPYCDYDDDANQMSIKKDKLSFEAHLQLSACTRSSTYSIPGIGTIQVTTPGNQHTHTIFDKEKKNEDENEKNEEENKEEDDDEDKTGFDYVSDEEVNYNEEEEDETFENIEFPYYQWKKMEREDDDKHHDVNFKDEEEKAAPTNTRKARRRRVPSLVHRNSNSRSRSNSRKKIKSNSSNAKLKIKIKKRSQRGNRVMATTPKFVRKPELTLKSKKKSGRHKPKSQTCTQFDETFLNEVNNAYNTGIEPDSYQSIVFGSGAFCSRNISMISSRETQNKNGDENVIKFTKPFNKMVADDAGNIFIGTDKYIRYVTYKDNKSEANNNDNNKYRKFRHFRKQEKLLYELRSDEHLVSLWNQNGKIYFVTMPYALPDKKNYRDYKCNDIRQWSLNLFVVENKNNLRQKANHKYEWIPPSVHDKLPYRKLRTFRWKVKGRFIENFLSLWYDEKYDTLITLAECDRLAEPQIIFLNKKNDRGLLKLKIRSNIFSIYGSDDSHGDDGVDNHLLIRHKPTKSWLCCVSCVDYKYREDECWIQFKLNRENNCILSSKIIKLPEELRNKKWLTYDKHRDCLIGINRLNIEQLLGLNQANKNKKNEIELIVVPRLTKFMTKNACDTIRNDPKLRKAISCKSRRRK